MSDPNIKIRTGGPRGPLTEQLPKISRRAVCAVALLAPVSARASQPESTSGTVEDLVRRSELQAKAFQASEMQRWYELIRISDDFTLMQPFGGPTSHGFDGSAERLAELSRNFRNGDGKLESVQSCASDDLVVLAFIERQHGEVFGLPDQDWSLRVTQVYRRNGAEWQLVHRHADPLVRKLSLERTAAIARGE